jgi:hypothetical protein
MSEQNQAEFNEDDSNSNANLSFCNCYDGNGKELVNELKWKVAALEVQKDIYFIVLLITECFEDMHLEEKVKLLEEKQIQEKKYSDLETKMRNLEVIHILFVLSHLLKTASVVIF